MDPMRGKGTQRPHAELTLAELQNGTLEAMLKKQVQASRIDETEMILIVDFADAEIPDPLAFAQFTTGWIEKLHQIAPWKRIVVEASSYPSLQSAG